MSNERCEAEDHEPDFETLQYVRKVGVYSALLRTACVHCGATAELTVDANEADWIDKDD